MKNSFGIYTIFGEIEHLAAEIIIKKYDLMKIEVKDFPPTVALVNEDECIAKYAFVLPYEYFNEYESMISKLRN